MELGFTEKDEWILPNQGTLGNKAKNLLDNSPAIKAHDFKIPHSLVIPFEYLRAVDDPEQFTLEQIDKYFPGWLRVAVRSNAPDEDKNARIPGQYVSEYIWHKDRWYAKSLINNVLESYDMPSARLRRKQLGLKNLGMCLLIQDIISNTPGKFDAFYVGVFSDIGESALLSFGNPSSGLEAMMQKSLEEYWVDSNGYTEEAESKGLEELAPRLRKLADCLPLIEGKGWEIEFAGNRDGDYVLQTTPIFKSKRLDIPDSVENIFDCIAVVGTGKVITEGILYAPFHPSIEELVKFDTTHQNYCLVTAHSNIVPHGTSRHILNYLANPAAIIDIKDVFFEDHPYSIHIKQYMREGRVALAGKFNNEFSNALVGDEEYHLRRSWDNKRYREVIYSPTKLFVKANEMSQKGSIALADGKIHDFVPISNLV